MFCYDQDAKWKQTDFMQCHKSYGDNFKRIHALPMSVNYVIKNHDAVTQTLLLATYVRGRLVMVCKMPYIH